MRTFFLATFVLAGWTSACAQWTKSTPPSFRGPNQAKQYPARDVVNVGSSSIAYPAQDVKADTICKVTGSTASYPNPPWTYDFLGLYNIPGRFDERIPAGNCPAHTTRKWWWDYTLDTGKEQWTNGSQSETRELHREVNFFFTSDDYNNELPGGD